MEVEHFYDKSEWPDGPWINEPDLVKWVDQATGLRCLIRRRPEGNLNGYVGVLPDHPFYRVTAYTKLHDDPELKLDLKVHGGVTYDGKFEDICPHTWWFGFDTHHYNDKIPFSVLYQIELDDDQSFSLPAESSIFPSNQVYRDLEYVRDEVTSLAWQIYQIAVHYEKIRHSQ